MCFTPSQPFPATAANHTTMHTATASTSQCPTHFHLFYPTYTSTYLDPSLLCSSSLLSINLNKMTFMLNQTLSSYYTGWCSFKSFHTPSQHPFSLHRHRINNQLHHIHPYGFQNQNFHHPNIFQRHHRLHPPLFLIPLSPLGMSPCTK